MSLDNKKHDYRYLVLSTLAIAMALYHMVAASPFVILSNLSFRAVHLLFSLLIIFVLFPSKGKGFLSKIKDAVLIILSIISLGYVVLFSDEITVRPPWTLDATPLELFVAISAIVVVLEATRRSLGMTIVYLCLAFIIYAFVGPYLIDFSWLEAIAHGGVSLNEFVDQMFFSFEGIFGSALGVSADYIFLFVIFGSVLQLSGGGDFFIAITKSLTGKSRGGPAKMAVVASGLMGMMSGSAVANVATTGSLTIPLMKKLGYPPRFAGAVEAIASTGGQIAPPIMGAAAFLMAAMLGIDYIEVALASTVPALLFYVALLIVVHLVALKLNLAPLKEENEKSVKSVILGGWTFIIPIGTLVTLMLMGYSPSYSAFYGIIAALITPYLRRCTFVSLKSIKNGVVLGVEGAVTVAAACAAAGIIVGVVQLSGLGFRFSSLVIELSNGSLDLALVLAMLAAFVFGMGMPTTAAYIIQATLVAPALVELGAEPLAAHLFVFYYAVLGQITPPVAVAAYAAAPIAGESPSKVGWSALLLALPVYIIPFLFVSNYSLLSPSLSFEFFYSLLISLLAISIFCCVIIGWLGKSALSIPYRAILFVLAVLMIYPDLLLNSIALLIFVLVFYMNNRKKGLRNEFV